MSSNSEHVLRHRRRKKLILIEYKGGKCEECGYDKMCPPAFDFHHKNPKTKEFQIGSSLQLSLDKLKKEVDKCQLLCNRCHAELHFNLRKLNNDDIALRQQPAESLIIKCRLCQIEFETKNEIQNTVRNNVIMLREENAIDRHMMNYCACFNPKVWYQ